MTNQQRFIKEFNAAIAKAETLYSINMSDVGLFMDMKGNSCLGTANRTEEGVLFLRFNEAAIEEYYDHMVTDTLPHEVAHMVEIIKHGYSDHGGRWKNICSVLGGNPTRCFNGAEFPLLKPARKMKEWLYRTENGVQQIFSTVRHNRMQNKGTVYKNSTASFCAKHFVQEIK